VGSVINGKWQIDARIGAGGMSTVYAATHRNGHRAALKLLHLQLSRDASTRARFLREGYVANAIGHPNVVGVLDDGVAEDGSAFLVLELLEGETMEARRVRLGGRLPLDQALDIADDALAALAAAHEKGIVHRDVKPDNVFLTKDGGTRLLDFGLARMKEPGGEVTRTGVTIGTPEFMPPEQAMGRRDAVDARSDVWGLGATLFTAITGRYVHEDAQSIREQLVASATRRSLPIRQFAPHVTPALAAVLDRALELEMNDRWQSAAEMRAALRAARGTSDGFTAESATLLAAPTAEEQPASSDQTVQLPSPGSVTEPHGVSLQHPTPLLERRPFELSAARPGATAFDIEETVAETPYSTRSVPASPSRPPAPPQASRPPPVPGRGGAHVPLGAPPQPSRPPPSYRSPLLTPSGEHETVPGHVSTTPRSRHPPARPRAFAPEDAHAETIASPNGFPVDEVPRPATLPTSIPPPGYLVPATTTPRAGEPREQAYRDAGDTDVRVRRVPPAGGSGRAIAIVSLVLIVLCAAMAAYVLWRGVPVR
jgi:serine/threonine-protein kinase